LGEDLVPPLGTNLVAYANILQSKLLLPTFRPTEKLDDYKGKYCTVEWAMEKGRIDCVPFYGLSIDFYPVRISITLATGCFYPKKKTPLFFFKNGPTSEVYYLFII
jgi:hypothetical protein